MSGGFSGGFTPEFLEELKYKCDIVDVISQYVPLQKKGGKYFGCCPFHNEKTASFCVNQAQGYYHCFGCGVSGNVIKFIMEIESVSFVDAVKLLADKAGMQLPEFKADPSYAKKKERSEVLKQLMRDAARYYRNNLVNEEKGKDAREYLENRGISEETAKRYGLGLSLDYDSMPGYLRRKGYSVTDLKDCGLINGDKIADAFANRIIVPIMNGMNEVVAFGGRIYHGEKDVAKYKNSTNTQIFDKGRTIYGINFVKKDKKENGGYKDLILVEGYMDVISLGSAGIRNAVAGMGTALTDAQATELKRLVSDIYVCYDGDAAGRKAAVKNIDPLVKCGLNVKVVSLNDGEDPDETVRREGRDGFMRRVDDALSAVEYKLKLCADAYDLDTVDGRAKYVTAALRVLKSVPGRSEREVYLKTVSELSRVSVNTLSEESAERDSLSVKAAEPSAAEKEAKAMRAARFLLNRILNAAPYTETAAIKKEWLPHAVQQEILEYAQSVPEGELNVGNMYLHVADDGEIDKILDAELTFANKAKEAEYYYDCLLILANSYISGRLEFLKQRFNSIADADERRIALREINDLTKRLKSKQFSDKL